MENESQSVLSYTANFRYIESALKNQWVIFELLSAEVRNFVPRTIADFSEERASELDSLRKHNPNSSDENLLEFIDSQITRRALPSLQYYLRFGERIMSEYVTVAFLSHALCESAINTILAIGLARAKTPELFTLLERSDIKDKWCIGPKSFHPAYSLPKDGELYKTLQHLTRQRNALVHYKIELEMQGEPVLSGSHLERVSLKEELIWIQRFFSLPYDLVEHARLAMPQQFIMFLFDSGPIQRASIHNKK